MTLSPAQVRWLSLIRYQTRVAEEQSLLPPPLATLAIAGLQDAVEAMLGLIAEHHNIELKRRTEFDKLFDDVTAKFTGLGHYRSRLLALNVARVGYKHHGNEVGETTVERHRINAINFLVEASQLCLSQVFDAVSLAGFIRDDQARARVEEAAERWANGDAEAALGQLRLAFDQLVRDYDHRKVWYQGKSLFDTEPSLRPFELQGIISDKVTKFLLGWIEGMNERMKLLALGVDLRRFVYFDAHAPQANYMFTTGEVYFDRSDGAPPITEEIYQRCYRFVLDTALQFGAEDYDFDAWAGQQARRAALNTVQDTSTTDDAPGKS